MTPTRILVVGGGGREHALAWKLAGEPGINRIHVAPGSAGIAREPRVTVHPSVAALDVEAVVALAAREAIELVVIGPEAPLAVGLADALERAGVAVFGPTQAAAMIETSKAFCRDVAAAAGVAIAAGRAFERFAPALTYARELCRARGTPDGARGTPAGHGTTGVAGVVVKADGLAAGKGVTVCDTEGEAEAALRAIFAEPAGHAAGPRRVVIEERLFGPEASLIALCDGRDAIGLMPARDHKRLADGDHGPNTGGMGAYTPLPDLAADVAGDLLETVHRPILAELARRGAPFRGALYVGFILTADGPRLLECNARFGDPEAQVLLPTVGVALAPLLGAAARGELLATARRLGIAGRILPSTGLAAVGIVLAASGYPAQARRGDPIRGIGAAEDRGALVFHSATTTSSTSASADSTADAAPVTNGGRVLTVVGRGRDLAAAREIAEEAADLIAFAGVQRRHDIAADPPAPAPSRAARPDLGAPSLAAVR